MCWINVYMYKKVWQKTCKLRKGVLVLMKVYPAFIAAPLLIQ